MISVLTFPLVFGSLVAECSQPSALLEPLPVGVSVSCWPVASFSPAVCLAGHRFADSGFWLSGVCLGMCAPPLLGGCSYVVAGCGFWALVFVHDCLPCHGLELQLSRFDACGFSLPFFLSCLFCMGVLEWLLVLWLPVLSSRSCLLSSLLGGGWLHCGLLFFVWLLSAGRVCRFRNAWGAIRM